MFWLTFKLLLKQVCKVPTVILYGTLQIKKSKVWKLSKTEKLKLKNSRPTPDVSITQDSGMKFYV